MAANKTVETDVDVAAFVAGVADPAQRADADTLIDLMSRVSGAPARMWGPSIIGFGSYTYRYDSGREGTSLQIGFSPRKGQTVLYGLAVNDNADLLKRLGKHKTGKGCLYIKRLSDVDLAALEELCAASLAEMARRYPD
jgi:Domain of unknown function (DU1801)